MANLSRTTRDHEEIRRWAEERGGKPTHVKNTGSREDIGILRIDFPGYSGEGSLEPISWEDFFAKFDERGLALVYQEETAGGQKSNFNKLVSAETAGASEARRQGPSRARSSSSRARQGSKSRTAAKTRTAGKKSGTSKKAAGSGSSRKSKRISKKAAPKKASSRRAGAKKSSKAAASKRGSVTKKSSGTRSAAKKGAAKRRR